MHQSRSAVARSRILRRIISLGLMGQFLLWPFLFACATEKTTPGPTMTEIYIITLIGDTQDIGLAVDLVGTNSSVHPHIKSLLSQMLENKIEALIDIFPSVKTGKLLDLACRSHAHTTETVFEITNSCSSDREFCEKAYKLQELCVDRGALSPATDKVQ